MREIKFRAWDKKFSLKKKAVSLAKQKGE